MRPPSRFRPLQQAVALALLSQLFACASPGKATFTPVEATPAQPSVVVTPPARLPEPPPPANLPKPVNSNPPVDTAPVSVTPPIVAPAITPPAPVPAWQNDKEGRRLLDALLPRQIKDRAGWSDDIFNAFATLKIPYTAEYFCGALSVIEQESSWQADPVVPGLGKMVWKEIGERAERYHVPLVLIQAAMSKSSRDGRSYNTRINALRTEKEMNALFEEIVAELGRRHLPSISNPIRTGGPMQVGVEFAQAHAKAWPYPYPIGDSIRHEVFSRRGGLYFGIAHLLHYRADYSRQIYRFADFNAGRYASRNAAFQLAVDKLASSSTATTAPAPKVVSKSAKGSKPAAKPQRLTPDGDLLRYERGAPSREASDTLSALLKLTPQLGMSRSDIERDLQSEKTERFGQTLLYRKVYELADKAAGKPLSREALPQIKLSGPKIQRKLTTAWFAERVDGRFRLCMARVPTI
ncbi:DUF1615 domain-containing protein [Parachitinimonas caeni]|uniref:DUF1615 domain-containing protein n=1 Tax=Parachitinimonas caeni TaxID=3031301 RepID=A0ABT7DW35_9NEIS|nr:DUF1615 domain-containing protein [Parachitinimonas caeni]MDK2124199.1 DUF1615 domain-containing protein [Parachitinimonas caeni]